MKIGVLRETAEGERRVAMTPHSAQYLQKLGHECIIETNAGKAAGFNDDAYRQAGVSIVKTAKTLWKKAHVVIKVQPAPVDYLELGRKGQTLINFFDSGANEEGFEKAKDLGLNVIAMEMVPRVSRAQKMDVLSSMANIAGYRAVIEATHNFSRFLTGQITAAGKVDPAKVLVIGAGVAGLAAIGTAKSLGAIVYAFDVRAEVAEQIESMGAEFLMLDFEEDASGSHGYAAPSSPEFLEKQLECFRKYAPEVDIVITTAQIPHKTAPQLWLKDMVESMKAGSVIVDLAAERGGNCEVTVKDKAIVTKNGVTVLGYTDYPSRMATQSSVLYANNIRHMIDDLTPEKDGKIVHNMEDDVIRGATVVYGGEITFPPPPPKVQAIAKQEVKKTPQKSKADLDAELILAERKRGKNQILMLILGGLFIGFMGKYAPASFMQHFIVFVLACFIGFQVIWNVSHSLHTPLMSVTNAISGIVIIGALLQVNSESMVVWALSSFSILIATINIVGGFVVTRRMLAMFQRS